MDKVVAGIVLICIVCFLIAVLIVVSNFFLNDDVEELDDLSEEAINQLKKQLLGTLNLWITENRLTNVQVSDQLKIRKITTEKILLQKVDNFSIDQLIVFLHRAGIKSTISMTN